MSDKTHRLPLFLRLLIGLAVLPLTLVGGIVGAAGLLVSSGFVRLSTWAQFLIGWSWRGIRFIEETLGFADHPHCGGTAPRLMKPHCGHPPHCGRPPCDPSWIVIWWALTPMQRLILWVIGHQVHDTEDSGEARKRIAFVSVWGIPCGIATYNSMLVEELKKYADVHVFAEYADDEGSERLPSDPEWVTRCWDRREHPKIRLIREVEAYQPDIVHVSHEYGLFPSAIHLNWLVSRFRALGMVVLVTLHSIYEHLDKTVHEGCLPNIIAHTQSGKDVLVRKGISASKINVVPHGTKILDGTPEDPKLLPSLWNTWQSEHTIFQPGFLFAYKGHKRMLGIVAKLKKVFPDVHYIVQASENPRNQAEHDEIYADLMAEIGRLGLMGNVTIHRGFVSDEVLLSYVRTAKCVVLPYQSHPDHQVRATSGVGRIVVATETPLVTSDVPLFDDLAGGVALKGGTDEEIFTHIRNVFSDWKVKRDQCAARIEFLKETSWQRVASEIADIYERIG